MLVARIDDPAFHYMTARMQRDLDVLSKAVDADDSVGAALDMASADGAPPRRSKPGRSGQPFTTNSLRALVWTGPSGGPLGD